MEASMQFPAGPQGISRGISVNDVVKLAHSFQVSRDVVLGMYEAQYGRLAAKARIGQFVDLLAFKNTRLALREIARAPSPTGDAE